MGHTSRRGVAGMKWRCQTKELKAQAHKISLRARDHKTELQPLGQRAMGRHPLTRLLAAAGRHARYVSATECAPACGRVPVGRNVEA
jgi:hypothetical protein